MIAEPKTWRCFHCDDVFTTEVDARHHFGSSQASDPACLMKVAGEFALLEALRNAEDELGRYRNEDSDVLRVLWSTRADQGQALRREEEKGYARGLEDAKKHPETLGLRAGLETFSEPVPRYQCMVEGCPGEHPSKWAVCTAGDFKNSQL